MTRNYPREPTRTIRSKEDVLEARLIFYDLVGNTSRYAQMASPKLP